MEKVMIKLDANGNVNIDYDDPNSYNDRVMPEDETRRKILNQARRLGCETEIRNIFNKIDKLMRNCTNESERLDIGKMGALEVYKMLGLYGKMYVNNELVINKG